MSWKELNKEMEKIENIVESLEDNPTRDDIEEDDKLSEGKIEKTQNLPSFEAMSEPPSVIRGAASIGSPPSYRRFSSPRPPKLVPLERKMSAGILRNQDADISVSRKKSEPHSPSLSVDSERKMSAGILRHQDGDYSISRKKSEPHSPTPSVDRLSVTFALDDEPEEDKDSVNTEFTEQPNRIGNISNSTKKTTDNENKKFIESYKTAANNQVIIEPKNLPVTVDPRGPESIQNTTTSNNLVEENNDEYEDIIMEIQMNRSRGSLRRSSGGSFRRKSESVNSSIILPARRRPRSGRTSSSGESLMSKSSRSSKGDLETLKLHNEVIEQAKYQNWPIQKKLRVVQQAKQYVRRHNKDMEERLAQSKTCASRIQQLLFYCMKYIMVSFKYIKDLISSFTPWQGRIKDIESHFGSVVSSYFVFLRWIFWMNLIIAVLIAVFVIVPEVLAANREAAGSKGARKDLLRVEKFYAYNFVYLWEFEGALRYSPIFYGYYSKEIMTSAGYRIPLAYFCSMMAVYVFSFAIILKKINQNNKQSKLSEKGDECTFTWKVFASWDYGIANIETAHNKVSSITMGFREALLDAFEKQKEDNKDWRVTAKRATAQFLVLILLAGSAFAVITVVKRSAECESGVKCSFYRQNEITIIMNLIGFIVPNIFDILSLLEDYHPRKAMNWMLGRIMVLNLLSLYALIIALIDKTGRMTDELRTLEQQQSQGLDLGLGMVTEAYEKPKNCYKIPIPCEVLERQKLLLSKENLGNTIYSIEYNIEQVNYFGNNNNTDINIADDAADENDMMNSQIQLVEFLGENCTSNCTDTCGFQCLALCNLTCSIGQDTYDVENNINDTVAIDECQECLISNTSFGISSWNTIEPEDDTTASTIPNNNDDDDEVVTSFEVIPLEEKQCVKTICRNNYDKLFIGTKPPPDEVPIVVTQSCEDYKDKYIEEMKVKLHLRKLCWETMYGQELVKLTIMDTLFTLGSIVIGEFGRSLFLRVLNPFWPWDLELKFPKYPDFKVAENVLHLVNNQGMVWMGLFMAPGLPIINLVKLAIIMYVRSWAVMTSNVPHETVFKIGSNNFYYFLLLAMLFLTTLPVAYTVVKLKPSWHCGPFSDYDVMYKVFSEKVIDIGEFLTGKGGQFSETLDYITSPGIIIPTLLLLVLLIFFLISYTSLLRESNNDLKNQLHQERTEERRKLVKGKQDGSATDMQEKWKKLLGSALSSHKEQRFDQAGPTVDISDMEKGNEDTYSERAIDVPANFIEEKLAKNQGPKNFNNAKQRFLSSVRPTSELSFQSVNEITSIGPIGVTPEGSMCNAFNLDKNTYGGAVVNLPNSKDPIKPPKVWISHSASMDDHDQEENEGQG